MSGDGSFRVEEFLEALTSQLDRTQDALRLKAVNRPLTYAIKDFSLTLQVFVELDEQGDVRLRSSGPNETGASSVSIGFTTITRSAIDENTIRLSETQGPSLDELGIPPEDQRRLEKIGVRNAAQLKRLSASSGEGAVARFANVPVNRLRAALQASRPRVDRLTPAPAPEPSEPAAPPARPALDDAVREPSLRVPRGTRRLRLDGSNLKALQNGGSASLEGMAVPVVEASDDHVVLDLGDLVPRGRLELGFADAETLAFQLETETVTEPRSDDPWSPA
ncbi:hypothetical protein [Streptomyces sp. HUAS ZL42]|uniref:hypothetical protein n=1 Tax=Streptomyces sp. HUAS ZL42 TaxID=3231715 RepID=UPI00345E4A37